MFLGVNIVREHPYYSNLPNCKMAEKIKEIESRLANQKFSALHPSMTKSKGLKYVYNYCIRNPQI